MPTLVSAKTFESFALHHSNIQIYRPEHQETDQGWFDHQET